MKFSPMVFWMFCAGIGFLVADNLMGAMAGLCSGIAVSLLIKFICDIIDESSMMHRMTSRRTGESDVRVSD